MLFYKKGLREFLAACGVVEPSASAPPCGGVLAEGRLVAYEIAGNLATPELNQEGRR